ncbi:hypothetical protein IU459_10200 [Nocardia amamiensis]|uniref:Uncharacterized protein n=1 Tax=Nocardia amamiensis TaxID=404578 RepID=A0ABS0CQ31_9NOCA|nr:hypothetical protein [Nocardia amamiensis]MBF6297917.1 hypothetical protein [Nocardia amamiensis]
MRLLRQLFTNLATGLRRDFSRTADGISSNYRGYRRDINDSVAELVDTDIAGRNAFGQLRELPEYLKSLQRLGYSTSVRSGLGSEVDRIAEMSEDLIRKIQDVQQDGWSIRYGKRGDGTYADYDEKAIVLDSKMKDNPLASADALAHEIDHAHPGNPHNDAPSPPMGRTRKRWVDDHVDRSLLNEGHAVMSQLTVRHQILQNGGPDINHSAAGKYLRIYERYRDGEFPRDEAVQRIAAHYRFETGSNSKMPYGQQFREWYEDYWDRWIAQTVQTR